MGKSNRMKRSQEKVLVARLGQAVVDTLDDDQFVVNACILGTRLMVEAASRNGLKARALPTATWAANREGLARIKAGIPTEEWPDDAWSITIDPRMPYPSHMTGYKAHLVAIIEGRWLVDTTAKQMHRPQHNLCIPDGPVILPWHSAEGMTEATLYPGDEREAYIGYMDATAWMKSDDYRTSRDWTDTWRSHIADVVKAA